MAITHVQDLGSTSGPAASKAMTYTDPVTAGSLLICLVNCYYAGASPALSISDNNGNSWNEIYDNNYSGSDVGLIAYAENANSGSTQVTVTATSGSYFSMVIIEVSGIATSGSLDQSNQATGSSSSAWDSGNISTTQADEYIVGVMGHDSTGATLTPDGAFTEIYEYENQVSGMPISTSYRIVSSTLTESYSGSFSTGPIAYWAAVASFKGAAGGPADDNVSASDGATIGESVTVDVSDPQVTTSDGLAVGESVAMSGESFVAVEDGLTIGESVEMSGDSFVAVSDGLTVSDSPAIDPLELAGVSVSDNVVLEDTPNVSLGVLADLDVNVSDGVTIGESVQRLLESFVDVSDGLAVADATTIDPLTLADVSVSDALTVGENATLNVSEADMNVNHGVDNYDNWVVGVRLYTP